MMILVRGINNQNKKPLRLSFFADISLLPRAPGATSKYIGTTLISATSVHNTHPPKILVGLHNNLVPNRHPCHSLPSHLFAVHIRCRQFHRPRRTTPTAAQNSTTRQPSTDKSSISRIQKHERRRTKTNTKKTATKHCFWLFEIFS